MFLYLDVDRGSTNIEKSRDLLRKKEKILHFKKPARGITIKIQSTNTTRATKVVGEKWPAKVITFAAYFN